MAYEIERKYLVRNRSYVNDSSSNARIRQSYLCTNPDSTVRLRIIDNAHAYITVKSRNNGATRHEWEYEIPVTEAEEMLGFCSHTPLIDKTRYKCGRWEIDEFHGSLEGLALAEIELESADEQVALPDFAGREVTGDKRYYNSSLISECALPPLE